MAAADLNRKPSLLIVEDEKNTREGMRRWLERRFDVYLAPDAQSAVTIMETDPVDLVITDLRLGGGEDGMDLLAKTQTLPDPPLTVLMTAYGSTDVAIEAMKRGAYDYVTKPLNLEEVEILLLKAWRSSQVECENRQLREELDTRYGLEKLIGNAPAMVRVFDVIKQVASSPATVLVDGESGTGKELVAHAIHQLSGRKSNPFVVVHCAALSPQLLESELFGHERGAFTGATSRRVGRFEQANHGTLFLDEIGEIDSSTQVKLLRALGERTIQRVGGNSDMKVDVRVVAATNRDLQEAVDKGEFREDLFFRLRVVPIHMPPLRERVEDIPLLLAAFLKEFAKAGHKKLSGVTSDALEALARHSWPGNVRELRSAVEYAVTFARGERIGIKDLPDSVFGDMNKRSAAILAGDDLNLERMERRMIEKALRVCNGNRTEAAQKLDISRRTLHRKIKEYGLEEL